MDYGRLDFHSLSVYFVGLEHGSVPFSQAGSDMRLYLLAEHDYWWNLSLPRCYQAALQTFDTVATSTRYQELNGFEETNL